MPCGILDWIRSSHIFFFHYSTGLIHHGLPESNTLKLGLESGSHLESLGAPQIVGRCVALKYVFFGGFRRIRRLAQRPWTISATGTSTLIGQSSFEFHYVPLHFPDLVILPDLRPHSQTIWRVLDRRAYDSGCQISDTFLVSV